MDDDDPAGRSPRHVGCRYVGWLIHHCAYTCIIYSSTPNAHHGNLVVNVNFNGNERSRLFVEIVSFSHVVRFFSLFFFSFFSFFFTSFGLCEVIFTVHVLVREERCRWCIISGINDTRRANNKNRYCSLIICIWNIYTERQQAVHGVIPPFLLFFILVYCLCLDCSSRCT